MNKFLYLIIGLIVFCAVLLAAAPASIVMSMVRSDLEQQVPDIKFGEASGSIWDGQTQVKAYQFPIVDVDWQLEFLPLLTGTVSIELDIAGQGIEGSMNGDVSNAGGQVHVIEAKVDGQFINQMTAGRGVTLAETFTARDVHVTFDRTFVDELSGIIDWPGGLIFVQTPEQYHSVSLPALQGTLASENDRINLSVSSDDQRLIDIGLNRSGWASVDVTYDFMDLAGLPYSQSDKQSGQASAILIEEKIL